MKIAIFRRHNECSRFGHCCHTYNYNGTDEINYANVNNNFNHWLEYYVKDIGRTRVLGRLGSGKFSNAICFKTATFQSAKTKRRG